MVNKKRKGTPKKVRYFFLNNMLHKTLHVNRASDLITTWCYPEKRRAAYSWSETQKNMEKAYSITEVAFILSRHRMTIDSYIREGKIRTPQRMYKLDGKFNQLGKYMFSEKDILELHEYCSTISVGRPRKDGLINSSGLPTRSELKAVLKESAVMYIKNDDGDFIPVWKENMW
jgi:hypothetical protein